MIAALLVILAVGGLAWRYQPELKQQLYWFTAVRGHVLSAAAEHALKPANHFQECTDCPDMVVLPAGHFDMGAPQDQGDKSGREYPRHPVTIRSAFAVGRVPVTFAQYSACAAHGDCDPEISGNTGDDRPAVNVTWYDAERYAAWLARITGKPYRLLSETEYEYAERGGTRTPFPWGDRPDTSKANCCGSKGTTPVFAFPANGFGLRDMVGNVYEWVADCFHGNYEPNPPPDESVWQVTGACQRRVIRGASWLSQAPLLRSSWRDSSEPNKRKEDIGFRVARSLDQ